MLKHIKKTVIGFLLTVLSMLPGCSKQAQRADEDFRLKIAIQFATLRYITNKDGSINIERAERVYDHAKEIQRIDSENLVSLRHLASFLKRKIKTSRLSHQERLAANIFIDDFVLFLSKEIEARFNLTNDRDLQMDLDILVDSLMSSIIKTLTSLGVKNW